ncbi:hypothetical protein GGR21_001910 [Dysgonomonas hofstadii]|uniref:Fibrobacter succinogenes major paralogous domain-containing protein n=1 Tax=Dysgonomonas hofstadii TaxID=637886 RepID=A0A840CMU4_9BACT|nr:FISUMP domain-containing protein [Dysgonomonas hofstadii]MBB4036009.1 hypothetical protein [Dysgonomonas hofstadii]
MQKLNYIFTPFYCIITPKLKNNVPIFAVRNKRITIGAHWDNVDWSVIGAGWRPIEGIFYNWYAATGRSYNDNPDSGVGTSIQEGANGNIGNEPAQRQGICPNGWYLPTDREWNQLEQYVYENITTGQYKTVYDAVDQAAWASQISSTPWQTTWNTTAGQRGGPIDNHHIGHGGAMKDICPPTASDGNKTVFSYIQGSIGYSSELYLGGFNAIAVGRIKATTDNSTDEYARRMIHLARAYNVNYWTSAQNNNIGSAWMRDFNTAYGSVNRTAYVKTNLLSVRCKKKD